MNTHTHEQEPRFQVICGGCLKEMEKMPDGSVDVIITSPPYNLGEKAKGSSQWSGSKTKGKWRGAELQNGYDGFDDAMPYDDYKEWQEEVLKACWRLLSPHGVMFYNHKPRVFNGEVRLPTAWIGELPLRQIIIWDRCGGLNANPHFYMPAHEWIMVFAKERFRVTRRNSTVGDVWRILAENNTPHPAPFPLELPMKALCTLGEEYRTVFDPFAGRGTVGIAANRTGRDFIGIEQSPAYCEIARQWHEVETKTFAPRTFGGLFAEA